MKGTGSLEGNSENSWSTGALADEMPHCESERTARNGTALPKNHPPRQQYLRRECGKRFNQPNTAMAELRTPSSVVVTVLSAGIVQESGG